MIDDGKISIDGKDIQVEILLAGDYKVYHVIIQNYNFARVMGGGHILKIATSKFTGTAKVVLKSLEICLNEI